MDRNINIFDNDNNNRIWMHHPLINCFIRDQEDIISEKNCVCGFSASF